MDADLARRELLLLGLRGPTALWEALVRFNELEHQLGEAALREIAASALRSLLDERSLVFTRAVEFPHGQQSERRLRRAEVAAALSESAWQGVPVVDGVQFAITPKGERALAVMLGGPIPGPRARALGRVVAGFAGAVQRMVRQRDALRQRHRGSDEFPPFGRGSEGDRNEFDDDAGLAGSRVPRVPPDRSGSGAAVATPEDDYEFESPATHKPGDIHQR
jgi:hypothetical protein